MKKSSKILLLVITIITIFMVMTVSSFAGTTATNSDIIVHNINGENAPLDKLTGVPNDASINSVCQGGKYVAIIGNDYTTMSNFVGYSKNGVDFKIVSEETIADSLGLSEYDSFYIDYNTITYEDGYFFIEYGYEDFYALKAKTTNFVDWILCEEEIVLSGDTEYVGEYNGYHIAYDFFSAKESNGKYTGTYYISNDGKKWTKKITPAMVMGNLESPGDMYGDIYFKIEITSQGVIMFFEKNQILDSPVINTSFSDYYITKDFKNYKKINLSAIGGCKGKENGAKSYYDRVEMVVTKGDESPMFYRMHGDINFYEVEWGWSSKILNCTTEIYTFDEKNNKIILDAKFEGCDYFYYSFITEKNYMIWTYNLDETNTFYKREGTDFTKSEIFALSGLQYHWGASGDFEDGIASSITIATFIDGQDFYITRDYYKTTFKVDLPFDYNYKTGVLYSNDAMTVYIQGVSGEESNFYRIEINELYNYIGTKISTPTNTYTGLFKQNGTWFYAKNGDVNFNYTGLVKYTNGKWYYVDDGVINFSQNGLCKYGKSWYYVKSGVVDKSYTGLVKHTDGKYYYVKSGVKTSFNGLVKYNGKWYYVKSGVVDKSYTGLVKHTDGKYYYVKSGVKTSFNGLVKYNSKWYYVKSGVVNTSYTGLVKHTDGKYYYVKSGVKTSFNGLVKYNSKWYYVKSGVVNTSYTGLVKHTDGKWYYVKKGVKTTYTGNVKYNGKTYKVKNGVKV